MLSLKEKYIKISSLFSVVLFQTYMNSLSMVDKDELELYAYIKGIQKVFPDKYFDDLFDYVDKNPKRQKLTLFLEQTFVQMLTLAREQLDTVGVELRKLYDQEGLPEQSLEEKYKNLLQGYYCSLDELNEMLEYFTGTEAFEKCEQIIKIKKKYYLV